MQNLLFGGAMLSKHEFKSRDMYGTCAKSDLIYPMRFHRQTEICLVTKGSLALTVEKTTYVLEEGDLYVIFPNVLHAVDPLHSEKQLWMFSPDLISSLSELLTSRKPQCPVIRAKDVPPLVRELIDRCVKLYGKNKVLYRSMLIAHTTSLIQELALATELTEWGLDRSMVQRLTEYLMENYKSDITLDSAATALGYSKFYISHAISEMFGCNFRTLIGNYRISAAQEALLQSGKSIWQIAYDCGFQNQSTFNRAFTKLCGMTPSEYRKINSKD